ncbi:unnamed protein product [Phytophthora fragariaefolia]|uniref:Unnamed protein product n=1 Tax=Phytophthora fragariaefolia TaxID=1490495 RepID=A0A9W6YB20_9STRA|nr:unnamed protein product [Phytophthora fragariaefolia]
MATPMVTSAVVVCRECLPTCDVDSIPHIVGLVNAYLDSFSATWTVSRACSAGISRRGLEYLASRDPGWGDGHDAAYVAVKKNFLHVLQWLNERYPDRTSWGSHHGRCLMNTAAERRHLAVLQWLHANHREKCTAFAMSIAASNGDLAIVKWLHENRSEGCTKQGMDDAAENGHLAVVEWLHSNRREGCTEDAMDDAAGNGHLEVVRFLHEHRREGCTSAAMNQAAANGHLEVVKYLRKNRTEGQPGTALRFAAENGRLTVAEWLYDIVREQRRSESCIRSAARAATEAGHADVARELEQKLKRQRLE